MARKKTSNRSKLTDADVKKMAKLKQRAEARYVFADGTVVTIQQVPAPLIYRLQSDAGKPTPESFVEVKGTGGAVMRVPDENDPAYQDVVSEMKDRLHAHMVAQDDPLLQCFNVWSGRQTTFSGMPGQSR